MAKETYTVITDDIDGSADAVTYTFSYAGTAYEIDLAQENGDKLTAALAPFIQNARRISGGKFSVGKLAAPKFDRAKLREWAEQNGYRVAERGRVPQNVLDAYNAAH